MINHFLFLPFLPSSSQFLLEIILQWTTQRNGKLWQGEIPKFSLRLISQGKKIIQVTGRQWEETVGEIMGKARSIGFPYLRLHQFLWWINKIMVRGMQLCGLSMSAVGQQEGGAGVSA